MPEASPDGPQVLWLRPLITGMIPGEDVFVREGRFRGWEGAGSRRSEGGWGRLDSSFSRTSFRDTYRKQY